MDQSDEVRILELTRERVSRQDTLRLPFRAADRAGRKVSPFSSDAVLFCGYDALLRSAYDVLGDEKTAQAMGERLAYRFSPLGPVDLMQIGYQGGKDEFLSVIDQLLAVARPPTFFDKQTMMAIAAALCLGAGLWWGYIWQLF